MALWRCLGDTHRPLVACYGVVGLGEGRRLVNVGNIDRQGSARRGLTVRHVGSQIKRLGGDGLVVNGSGSGHHLATYPK